MAETTAGEGILASENDDKREQIIELLEEGLLDGDRDGDELHRGIRTGVVLGSDEFAAGKATCSRPSTRPTSCT